MSTTQTTPQTSLQALPDTHLLSLPRPDPVIGPPPTSTTGAIDTTTLAAHDFDVDNRTGFMPPQPPISRLPPEWDIWEDILQDAQDERIQLGDSEQGQEEEEEKQKSERWRLKVKNMPMLPTYKLRRSELVLRRAHHVLAWILHFYVHSLPPAEGDDYNDILIPRSISLPLLRICAQLQLPPVLTYSDDVLYNWKFDTPLDDPVAFPTITTPLKCQTLFTHTQTEEIFYLSAVRIELVGVHALGLMRATMDELFVSDDIAVRRITSYLKSLSDVIVEMKNELLGIKEKGCDPETFFNKVRPWLRGCEDRKWVFEGLEEATGEEGEEVWQPVELSGPSAGQSSLIHALDIFLGVDKWSHSVVPLVQCPQQPQDSAIITTPSQNPDTVAHKSSFLTRMQQYMPRHHRHFLHHLAAKTNVREFVTTRASSSTSEHDHDLVEAYNGTIRALKDFRDTHLIVVALYIVGPAARARKAKTQGTTVITNDIRGRTTLRGTGGTDIVQFLKVVRDQTKSAVLDS